MFVRAFVAGSYAYRRYRRRTSSNAVDRAIATIARCRAPATPASICSRSSDDPARMSNGSFSCSYSYGGSRQLKLSGARARNACDEGDACLNRTKRLTIAHVDLAAAARRSGVLVERRLEDGRPEIGRRADRARSAPSANAFGVDPGRADQLERPRRPAPFRDIRAFEQHGARIDDRRVECRDVRRRQHPGHVACRREYISRRQPSIGTTSSSAPMPNCSLNRRASSPIVIPWRIGIGYRPTNDS